MTDTAGRIEAILRLRFAPAHLEIVDDSLRHAGHAGAASGGGHFRVTLVSAAFEGKSRLDQHRMVHAALGGMIGREIHALALKTIPASEWPGGPAAPR
ncbi:MAG: BolA family protein [Candidatus Polarisedimenticolia bacterium]